MYIYNCLYILLSVCVSYNTRYEKIKNQFTIQFTFLTTMLNPSQRKSTPTSSHFINAFPFPSPSILSRLTFPLKIFGASEEDLQKFQNLWFCHFGSIIHLLHFASSCLK